MKQNLFALLAAIVAVALLSCGGNKAKQSEAESTEGEWVSLFNGEDLTGVDAQDTGVRAGR